MDFLRRINESKSDSLEFGCGPRRDREGYVTVDLQDYDAVDIRGDAYEVLGQIENDSVRNVYASHFIEHLDDLDRFLRELARVCRNGSVIEFKAPHFSNAWFYSDVTHKSFFALYTFCYLAEDGIGFKRQVPGYARVPGLKLKQVRLGFGTLKTWSIRYYFRKGLQALFNAGKPMQEFYEDCLTGLFPCYDVFYRLEVRKPD